MGDNEAIIVLMSNEDTDQMACKVVGDEKICVALLLTALHKITLDSDFFHKEELIETIEKNF